MKKHIFLILIVLGCSLSCFSQKKYTVNTIPDPKKTGQENYVSNPDAIFDIGTVDALNNVCQEIEKANSAEVAIVAINDYKGDKEVFDFAMELFRKWGIGKKSNNNGLLFLIVTNRKKYQFITGYGLEADLTDYQLDNIGRNTLVPYFKSKEYGNGATAAINEIRNTLLHQDNGNSIIGVESNIDEQTATTVENTATNSEQHGFISQQYNNDIKSIYKYQYQIGILFLLLYILGDIFMNKGLKPNEIFSLTSCKSILIYFFSGVFILVLPTVVLYGYIPIFLLAFIQGNIIGYVRFKKGFAAKEKEYLDIENKYFALSDWCKQSWLSIILTPTIWLSCLKVKSYKKLMRKSCTPPEDFTDYKRLNWDDDIAEIPSILSKVQIKENEIGSFIYQIWTKGKDKKIIQYKGLHFRSYSECNACGGRTLPVKYSVKVIVRATYSSSGKGEKIKQCVNCKNKISLGFVVLPRLQESSSSSSSSSSSASSSSSSGSWGGGSSGGGGAGGSW